MRSRVVVGFSEIAPARDYFSVAHNDCAERIVALPGFLQRQAHEPFVVCRGIGSGGGSVHETVVEASAITMPLRL